MLCESCNEANKISKDRFKTKDLHDKCHVIVYVNSQNERCSCSCNVNTLPPYDVIAKLEGQDADEFTAYNERELNRKEKQSLNDSYDVYKNHNI
jgi:hypothetical protein